MKVLELLFQTEDGKTARLTIDNPVEPANVADVKATMEAVIASDIFYAPNGSAYVGIKGARFVARNVENVEIV